MALFLRPCQENALNLKFILFTSAVIIPGRDPNIIPSYNLGWNTFRSNLQLPIYGTFGHGIQEMLLKDLFFLKVRQVGIRVSLPRMIVEESMVESHLHCQLPHPGLDPTNSSSEIKYGDKFCRFQSASLKVSSSF